MKLGMLFQRLNFGDCGHINIRGMFSDPICVPLADIIMKRVGGRDHDDVAEGLPVMCAVVSFKDEKYDVVLPPDIAADFNLMPVTDVMDKRVNNDHVNVDDQTNDKYEWVSDVMNVVVDDDDDVNIGDPSSVTVSNDMKDEVVDNVVQLLPSDEGRVESDVRLHVVHTVDDVVTGEAKYYDDAGRGDDNADGGDCVAATNCGDVMHVQNNIVELLFIVLVLLKFTVRAVCDFSYHPSSIIDVMAACSFMAVITSELLHRLLCEMMSLMLYHLHSVRRDAELKQSICDTLLLMTVRPIIDWRSWSFGRGPISSTKAQHYDDDSRTCHPEYDVMKSRRSVYERTHWFVIVSTIVIVLLVLVSELSSSLFAICACIGDEFDTVTLFIDIPHFRM